MYARLRACVYYSMREIWFIRFGYRFFLLSSIAIAIAITSGKGVLIDEDGLVIRVVQLHKSVVIPLR